MSRAISEGPSSINRLFYSLKQRFAKNLPDNHIRVPSDKVETRLQQFHNLERRLLESGALDLLQSVAKALPDTTLEVNDDPNNNKGMLPYVRLTCPVMHKELDAPKKDHFNQYFTTQTTQRWLSVSISPFKPNDIQIIVLEETTQQNGSNTVSVTGSRVWEKIAKDKSMLPHAIFEGVQRLMPVDTTKVAQALGFQ